MSMMLLLKPVNALPAALGTASQLTSPAAPL
jgi:hypothetical protein